MGHFPDDGWTFPNNLTFRIVDGEFFPVVPPYLFCGRPVPRRWFYSPEQPGDDGGVTCMFKLEIDTELRYVRVSLRNDDAIHIESAIQVRYFNLNPFEENVMDFVDSVLLKLRMTEERDEVLQIVSLETGCTIDNADGMIESLEDETFAAFSQQSKTRLVQIWLEHDIDNGVFRVDRMWYNPVLSKVERRPRDIDLIGV